eukprot:TRINITY_DN16562_c0_g1_i2.p1 TRINITY_DN16562_c0_g1~~TRINITY_DN16562_c0_g1_i2.p1  ORF type:complete len:254 (+),score=50.16 TRINITY_DN16562_c0_g1_i2:74-763(+)
MAPAARAGAEAAAAALRSSGGRWRWAARRLPRVKSLGPRPLAHHDTADFLDAIHTSSQVLRFLFPPVRGLMRLRHLLRGSQPPAELAETELLANWNTADEFLQGAEWVHSELLAAAALPRAAALPEALRELSSAEVRSWLDAARPEAAEAEGVSLDVEARFERVGGPASLEYIRRVEGKGLGALARDQEFVEAFHHDTWNGATLEMEVAAVTDMCGLPSPSSSTALRSV